MVGERVSKPILVCGSRRHAIGFIEVDLGKHADDFKIINSSEGLRGFRGNAYSYALYLNTKLKAEYLERCKAGILNDLGVPR